MAHSPEEERIVTPEETGAIGGTPSEGICRKLSLPDGTLIQCSGEFFQQALKEDQEEERAKEQEMERETTKKEKELAVYSHPDKTPWKCGRYNAESESLLPCPQTEDVMEIWNKHLRKMHETNMRIVLFAPLLYNRSTLAPKWQQWMRKLDLIIDDTAPLEMKKEVFFRLDELDHILDYMDTQLSTMKSEDYNSMMGLLEDVEKVEELQVAMEIAKSNSYFSAFYEDLKTRKKMKDSNVGQLLALVTIKQYWQYVDHTVIHKKKILASLMKLSEKDEKEMNSLKDKGNNLFRNSKFRSAHEIYTKALAIGAFNHFLYGNRCQTSFCMEDFWDALWDARRAVTISPYRQKDHYRYARAFFNLKDIDRALHENKRGQKFCHDSGSQIGDLQRQATMFNDKKRKLVSLNSKKNEVPDLVSSSESDSESDSMTISDDVIQLSPGWRRFNMWSRVTCTIGASSKNQSTSDSGKLANYPSSQDGRPSQELSVIPGARDSAETKLATSDNAWKPRYKRGAEDKDEESAKTEELYHNFTSILNKLTPGLVNKLTDKALQLPIDTEERLKGVVKLTFEKFMTNEELQECHDLLIRFFFQATGFQCHILTIQAISEPIYSTSYAHMCQKLSTLKVQSSSNPGQIVRFRPILVHNCQQEFEKEKQSEIQRREEIFQLPANQQEAELELLQEKIFKAKKRTLGNIRFIGELYKVRILTENIMHNCIMKFLKAKDDDSLECVCYLMSSIGKDLDHEKAKNRMDQYFEKINMIIASQKNQPRIRFLMCDLVDLRKNNWVPRRQENKPTTINALHREWHVAEADDGRNMVTSINKTRMAYDPANLNPFVTEGVDFTLDGASAADNGLNSVSSQGDWLHVFKRGLTSLLNERPDNTKIFDWIEHNVSDTQKQHYEFIRALVTIICQEASEGEGQSCRIDPNTLTMRCPVLQRYIDNKPHLELQALYAVQALNHSLHNPPGLLGILFDVFYDEEVVTEEAFFNWKKSEDPKESAGKGVALKASTSFFCWLAEAEGE